jgi:hypothetical protein
MANLTSKSQIKVINNTKGSLSFIGIDGKKYLFVKENSYRMIDLPVVEGLYSEFENFVIKGFVLLDKQVYEYLGIPEDIYGKLISLSEVEELLEKSAEEIAEKLDEVSDVIKENIAMVAKEKKLDSRKKTKVIKEATGFDIEEENEEEE